MFTLDYRSRAPIYEQLYNNISRLAALGALAADEQLPSVRSLAQELGVNPNTVQKAYQMLEHDGIIYSLPGKGSFIASDLTPLLQKRMLAEKELTAALATAAKAGITQKEIEEHVKNFFNRRETDV